jgi:tryptophanyl-tRNA synthetase
MYTDPDHLRASDPGRAEGNVVFTYLDAFDEDREGVAELKAHYRRGGLGDAAVKRLLEAVLRGVVRPIRERRDLLARDPDYVMDILRSGTAHARDLTAATHAAVRAGLGLFALT